MSSEHVKTCVFCDNKILHDFYNDKTDLLYKFMSIFNEKSSDNLLPRVNESINKILYEFSNNIKDSISTSCNVSQENIKNDINNSIRDLEFTIETKNFKNKFTPSVKGAISEDNMYDVLSDELGDEWEIVKTNTSGSKKGDIFLQNEVSKIIIDLKDYSSNVPGSQVEKIKRDMKLHNSHGLLVSVNTNIAKHKDYTFELVCGKIIGYISKGNIVTKIKSWVNLIVSLEKILHTSGPNVLQFSEEDIEYISRVCKEYNLKISSFKEFLENNIKNSRDELVKLSNQKNEEIFLFLKSKILKN